MTEYKTMAEYKAAPMDSDTIAHAKQILTLAGARHSVYNGTLYASYTKNGRGLHASLATPNELDNFLDTVYAYQAEDKK